MDGWMDGDVVPVCSNVDVFTGHWWPVRGESLWQDYLMREWDECNDLSGTKRRPRSCWSADGPADDFSEPKP